MPQGMTVTGIQGWYNCLLKLIVSSDFQLFISQMYIDLNPCTKEFGYTIFSYLGEDSYNKKEKYVVAYSELNTVLVKDIENKSTKPEILVRAKEITYNISKTRISVVVFERNSVEESKKVF